MTSGNKQLHFKVLPERSHALTYVLYPLIAGEAVPLPRMTLSGTRPSQTQDANEILDRLLPKTIAVMPREKAAGGATAADGGGEQGHYVVGDVVTVENTPFKPVSRVVKA